MCGLRTSKGTAPYGAVHINARYHVKGLVTWMAYWMFRNQAQGENFLDYA
jgi:hypothetical protein